MKSIGFFMFGYWMMDLYNEGILTLSTKNCKKNKCFYVVSALNFRLATAYNSTQVWSASNLTVATNLLKGPEGPHSLGDTRDKR